MSPADHINNDSKRLSNDERRAVVETVSDTTDREAPKSRGYSKHRLVTLKQAVKGLVAA
jgi:hypothetical protein